MSTSRLIKNTGFLSLANALQPVISYFLIVAISQIWGQEGFGEYTTIFAYIALFQIISSFGLKTLLPREVARDPSAGRKLALHGAAVVLPFSIVSAGAMAAWIILMRYPAAVTHAGIVLSLALVPASLIECFDGVLIGYQRIQWIALIYTAENILRVGVSLVLVRLGFGLTSVVWVFVISKVLSLGFYIWAVSHVSKQSGPARLDRAFYLHFVRLAFPFVVIAIFVTLFWKLDVILLSKLTDMASVGVYSAAYRFFWLVMLVISSFVTSLFPILSEYFHSDTEAFERICFKAIRYFTVFVFPCVLGLFFLSKPIMLLIYGSKYLNAVPVLDVLCWALIPYGISEILAHSLIASNYQKIDLGINMAGMLIMAGLNWVLIHWLGFMGAAWAVLATTVIYLAIQIPFVAGRSLKSRPDRFLSDMTKLSVSAGFSVILWLLLKPIHWAAAAVVGLAAYPFFVWKFRIYDAVDAGLFLRVLRRLRTFLPGWAGSENV
jgi:O-antigen/teichoic acid export membrane protein